MKKIKAVLSSIFLCASLTLLTACSDIVQVDERAIVQAVGIDKSASGFKLSLQVFNPQGGSTTEVGGLSVKTIISDGYTISDALKNAELKQGKQIFLGHNNLIILGQSIKNDDLEEVLRYFVKDTMTFPGIDIVMSGGDAYDLVNLELSKGIISAQRMKDILNLSIKNGTARKSQLVTVISDLMSLQRTTTLPIVNAIKASPEVLPAAKKDSDTGKDTNPDLVTATTTALIKNGKVIAELNTTETQGIKWLSNDVSGMFLTVSINGEKIGIDIQKANVNLRPEIVDKKVVMHADIKVKAKAVDILGQGDGSKLKSDEAIENEINRLIMSQCESAIEATIKANKADALGIENYLKFYEKDFYLAMKDSYEDVLSDLTYDISIKSKVLG